MCAALVDHVVEHVVERVVEHLVEHVVLMQRSERHQRNERQNPN